MDLFSILTKVGGAALKSIPPVGTVVEILSFVNDILPDDKKLIETSTGSEALAAISSLPKDTQTEILHRKFDVELAEIKAHVDVTLALAEVDKTGHTTRPAIAKGMSQLIAFGVIVTLSPIAYAIVADKPKMILSISQIWPLIATVIGIPASIVNSYFGKRSKEKAQKYQAVSNTPPLAGIISQIASVLKK